MPGFSYPGPSLGVDTETRKKIGHQKAHANKVG